MIKTLGDLKKMSVGQLDNGMLCTDLRFTVVRNAFDQTLRGLLYD